MIWAYLAIAFALGVLAVCGTAYAVIKYALSHPAILAKHVTPVIFGISKSKVSNRVKQKQQST